MILRWHPWKVIILGAGMMLVSIILPLLMVMQVLRSTFFLNFLAFGLSIAGMLIGFIGLVTLVRVKRSEQKFKDRFK